VVDEVARRLGGPSGAAWKTKDGARQVHLAAHRVVLVKPLSFMNESGDPLGRVAAWWKAGPADVLAISDDLDLPFGRLRMRASGSSGGHNGLKSIIEHFGEGFPRLRVGIGRGRNDTIDYVLSNFDGEEERALPGLIDVAAEGVVRWLERGPADAIAFVNGWRPAAPVPPAPAPANGTRGPGPSAVNSD
jgi:PTH1 family peptidyl-tRNA hydrolase